MKRNTIATIAAAAIIAFSGNASAADSPVAYLGSTAGGSAYGSAFSSENANAFGAVEGGYTVASIATQNAGRNFDLMDFNDNRRGNDYCIPSGAGCSAGTATASYGAFGGQIGKDGGVVSGYTGGESLASVAKIGADMDIASAEHHSIATMATSGAGTKGQAVNTGFAVSQYSNNSNGSAYTAAH
jgi:hypothetical protein